VTPRERDRYAFLELLLATQDRLALSYVSRDPLTGEEMAPSSVVQELLHALGQPGVDHAPAKPETCRPGDAGVLRVRHPLRRWDPAYFPDLFPTRFPGVDHAPAKPGTCRREPLAPLRLPEARAEARTLALRESLESAGQHVTPADVMDRGQRDSAWAELGRHLRLAPLGDAAPDTEAHVFVPLYAIAKFLEFPLQAWARFRLGLDEREDDDRAAREDELFETGPRDETLFLRGVLLDARRTGRTIEQAYDAAARDRELRGSGPSGAFARAERGDHLETLETWCAQLEERAIAVAGIEVHRFGRGGEASRADRVHDALVIDVDYRDPAGVTRVVKAELSGSTLPLGADLTASLTLAKRREEKDSSRVDRAQLRAFVDHAVLTATGVAPGRPHSSIAVIKTPEETLRDVASFEPLTQGEAALWLREVVRDLLSGPHAYFLPCEVVLKHHAAGHPGAALSPALEHERAKLRGAESLSGLRSAYGPVPHVHEYPVPDDESAREMVSRRFGLLFAKRGS
jgi:exodeoxyribonuclease V gamma subunit